MLLRQIFDPHLAHYAYLIGCQQTGEALVIDPLRDIETCTKLAAENDLTVIAVAETHIHADFVSGAQEFARDPSIHLHLSAEGGPDWLYRWPGDRPRTHWLRHGGEFRVGKIRVRALHTPGHTPEHLSYLITDEGGGADEPISLVTGDFLFVGDVGRPDLLESAVGVIGGTEASARTLRHSLSTRLSDFGDYLQILPAHGAGSSCGKSLGAVPTSTLGYERRFNASLQLALRDEEAFVANVTSGQPEPPPYFATMKRVNRDGIRTTGGVPAATHLPATEFVEFAKQSGTIILDTRADRPAFDAAHAPRSIQAPIRSSFFSASAGSFAEEDDSILLIVETEADAHWAVRQLYRTGFDHVKGWITVTEARSAGLFSARIKRIEFANFGYSDLPPSAVILDARSSPEHAASHLPGAISLPYTRLKARLAEVPTDKTLFIHCGMGRRSALASSFLASRGYDVVHVDGEYSAPGH